MSGPDPLATRREVDQLREDLRRLDDHGSRGVAIVQAQLSDLTKDMLDLKSEMNVRFDAHQRVHDQDEQARVTARRWLIAAFIAAIAAVDGPIVSVVLAHGHR